MLLINASAEGFMEPLQNPILFREARYLDIEEKEMICQYLDRLDKLGLPSCAAWASSRGGGLYSSSQLDASLYR
jgi:hypothetical protein